MALKCFLVINHKHVLWNISIQWFAFCFITTHTFPYNDLLFVLLQQTHFHTMICFLFYYNTHFHTMICFLFYYNTYISIQWFAFCFITTHTFPYNDLLFLFYYNTQSGTCNGAYTYPSECAVCCSGELCNDYIPGYPPGRETTVSADVETTESAGATTSENSGTSGGLIALKVDNLDSALFASPAEHIMKESKLTFLTLCDLIIWPIHYLVSRRQSSVSGYVPVYAVKHNYCHFSTLLDLNQQKNI